MSSNRPGWMEGGTKRPKPPPQQPRPNISETPQQQHVVVHSPQHSGTHRNVVIGVTLLTLLTLFTTYFWLGIWFSGVTNPPKAGWSIDNGVELVTLDDYLTQGRVAFAVVAGATFSALTWMVADNVID